MIIIAIAACDKNNLIGKDNQIPWHLPEDLKFFRKQTENNIVIMGRKTWESIPKNFRPLPNRINIVLTSEIEKYKNSDDKSVSFVNSWEDALALATFFDDRDIYVIGGASLYNCAINEAKVRADRIILTRVFGDYEGDVYFPQIDEKEWIEIPYKKTDKFEIIEKVRIKSCIK